MNTQTIMLEAENKVTSSILSTTENVLPPMTPEGESVHIAFGVDASYFRGMGVTITSVIKNNPDLRFIFHVFAFAVSEDSRRRIDALAKQYGVEIHVRLLSPEMLDEFSRFPCFGQHSLGTFIRLMIPNNLAGIAERVLYLDADILCFGEVADLLRTDISDCIAAAAHDEAKTTVKTQVSALGLQSGQYFNAGVMYINVRKWIASDIQNVALRVLTNRELVFADQDALNIALDGQVKYVESKWNYRFHLVDFLSKGEKSFKFTDDLVFMHFTGPVKPWQNWCLHDAKDIFIDYQSISPWADVPLDNPKGARDLKLFSKFLIKQGRLWEGVNWHIKYLKARLAQRLKSS